MTVITLANSKGGSGKTLVAQLLLGTLASRGYRVAAIDADVTRTLDVWASTTADYPIAITPCVDETRIVGIAGDLETNSDLVVIDTAGTALQVSLFAIGCADLVLVPCQASDADVVQAMLTVALVNSAAEMTRRDIPARVLFTDWPPRTHIATHVENEAKRAGLKVLTTKLHRLVAYKEMTFSGEVPTTGTAARHVDELLAELKALKVLATFL